MSDELNVVYATKAEFIDPLNCGSMVAFKITASYQEFYKAWNSSVSLSDCNRIISWEFSDEKLEPKLKKIDKAIALLSEFRKELIKAQKQFDRVIVKERPKSGA